MNNTNGTGTGDGTTTNKTVITVITTTVAILAFSSMLTICILAFMGTPIPAELNSLAIGTFGALTGMLVKTSPTEATRQLHPVAVPSGEPTPTPVQVVNQPSDPVPTSEEPVKGTT